MQQGKEITIKDQGNNENHRNMIELNDSKNSNKIQNVSNKPFALDNNPPSQAFKNISEIIGNKGDGGVGSNQHRKRKPKNLWVQKNRTLLKQNVDSETIKKNPQVVKNNQYNQGVFQQDQENQLQNKNRKESNGLGGIILDFKKDPSYKQSPDQSPITGPFKTNSKYDHMINGQNQKDQDKIEENVSSFKNNGQLQSIKSQLQQGKDDNKKGQKQPVIQPRGFEWEAEIQNDQLFINKIFTEGLYRPSKDWKEQFEKDISDILLGSEVQDKRAVGSLLGITVFGIVGFVASGLNPIGLVAGAVAGGVIGQYAGRKIKKKLLRTKKLLQFDLFTLKLNCYIRFGLELIKPFKFDVNSYRFYMEKVIEEMKVAIQYRRFRQKFHKDIKKILEKLVSLMKKEHCYKAIFLSYKLTKEIIKRRKAEMNAKSKLDQQNGRGAPIPADQIPEFTGEEEDQIIDAVLNVLNPTMNILHESPDFLTPTLKQFQFKLEKLLRDYVILNLIDKENQAISNKNKIIKQIEELDQQLDQEINIEAFERIFNPEHIKQFMNKEDNMLLSQGQGGNDNINTPKLHIGQSANKHQVQSIQRKSNQFKLAQNNDQNQEFSSFNSNNMNPNNNSNMNEIIGHNKNIEDQEMRASTVNVNQQQEKRQQRIIDLYLEAIEMRNKVLGSQKKDEDNDIGDDENGQIQDGVIVSDQQKRKGSQNIPSQYPTFSKQHLSKIAQKESINQSPVNPFNNGEEELQEIDRINQRSQYAYAETNTFDQGSITTNIKERQPIRKVSNIQIRFDQIPQKDIDADAESIKSQSTPLVQQEGNQQEQNLENNMPRDDGNKKINFIVPSLNKFVKNSESEQNSQIFQANPSYNVSSFAAITQTNIHNIPPQSLQPVIPRSFARNDKRTFLKMNSDESIMSVQKDSSPTNVLQLQPEGDIDQPMRDSIMPSVAQLGDQQDHYKNQTETPQRKSNFGTLDLQQRGSILGKQINMQASGMNQQISKINNSQFRGSIICRDDNHKEEIVVVNIPEIQKDERMSQSIKSEDPNKLDKDTQDKFDRLISLVKEDPEKTWECVIKKDDSMFIYKKMIPGNPCVLVRAESTIKDCNSEEVFVQIYNAQIRSQWDKVTQGFTVIDTISEGIDVIYFFVDPGLGVTKRDFCQTRVLKKDYPEKGQITIVFFSIAHPSCPERKGYIRAHSHIAGYVIRPLGKDTSLTIMTQSDVKGSVPKYVVNFMAARAPPKWIDSMKKGCIDYRNLQNGVTKTKKKK